MLLYVCPAISEFPQEATVWESAKEEYSPETRESCDKVNQPCRVQINGKANKKQSKNKLKLQQKKGLPPQRT